MRPALLVAATTATFASAATALPVDGSATLATPASLTKIVGEGGVWRCAGNTCTGMADARPALSVAACSAVAAANGRVAAFTAGGSAFGDSEPKRCNRHVKSQ